jgi:phytoene dehydrogenase-like protein
MEPGGRVVRYDACVIGAGAEGLAAAAVAAAQGLKVIIAERETRAGGRTALREFHPGFRAPPYADELPAIPPGIFRALDLGSRGACLMPASASLAVWPNRHSLILPWTETASPFAALRESVVTRALAEAEAVPARWFRPLAPVWPGEELASLSLLDALAEMPERDHRLADVLAGALCDPAAPGSALNLLKGAPGGVARGLGEALRQAAEAVGAEISLSLEVADVKHKGARVTGVGLADGSEIEARAVLSTLDFKRTFLSLFAWNALPRAVVERVGAWRPQPGVARLLLALEAPPQWPAEIDPIALRGPIHVAPGGFEDAYRAWRRGAVPERPPAILRLLSAIDPTLAPDGAAVMSVTLGAIPHTPFDGNWTHDKRERLRQTAMAAAQSVFVGLAARVKGFLLLVPPDIEAALGATGGDLSGGELAPDQMLGLRPGPRTPFQGLYLAGPSSATGPIATCASGVAAARALIADFKAGRLK